MARSKLSPRPYGEPEHATNFLDLTRELRLKIFSHALPHYETGYRVGEHNLLAFTLTVQDMAKILANVSSLARLIDHPPLNEDVALVLDRFIGDIYEDIWRFDRRDVEPRSKYPSETYSQFMEIDDDPMAALAYLLQILGPTSEEWKVWTLSGLQLQPSELEEHRRLVATEATYRRWYETKL